jgi:methionyl-tRNA formyltransferase
MLLKWETSIGEDEDALQLGTRLAEAGADLLVRTLVEAVAPTPQDNAQATYAPILKKEDGVVDWRQPARNIFNRSRGFLPWPGTWTQLRGQVFHLWRSRVAEPRDEVAPGRVIADRRRFLVQCGEGTVLELLEVQVEGRKRVAGSAFLNGWKPEPNEVLGQ